MRITTDMESLRVGMVESAPGRIVLSGSMWINVLDPTQRLVG